MAGKKKKQEGEEKATPREQTAFEKELKILLAVVLCILFILSYANAAGVIGSLLSKLSFGLFGFVAYALPILAVGAYVYYIANLGNSLVKKKIICVGVVCVLLMALLHLITFKYQGLDKCIQFFSDSSESRNGGGFLGGLLANLLGFLVGTWGAYVVIFALMAVCFMFLSEKLLFHSLGKKSSRAYRKVKEKAAKAAEERAITRAEQEDLEALEDWEREEIRPRKAKFFSFKKDSEDEAVTEKEEKKKEKKEEKKEKGDMQEIVSEESGSDKKEVRERKVDYIDNLIIHRGDRLKKTSKEEVPESVPEEIQDDIPIYQQELLRKFSEEKENAEAKAEKSSPEQSDEVFMEQIEEELESFVCGVLHEQEEETGAIVLDAKEEDVGISPEQAISRLSQPVNHAENAVSVNKPEKRISSPDLTEIGEDVNLVAKEIEQLDVELAKAYEFPSIDLLAKPKRQEGGMSDEVLKQNARKLQETLESFGVGAKIINVSCGPSVTRYELQPDQGVKVSKITALADDIKLNMAAEEIRIEAPIPGKAAVGIEVPNESTTMVSLRDLVENQQFLKHESNIAFAVGKDIGGQVVVTDIAKMPHLLIAGATGSGKSVCINTLIMSILYKAHPDDVKLIMVDPKVVELSCYNGIPHLLIPVVTDPKKASSALQWAVQEMDARYKKFAELTVRDIHGYNKKMETVADANDDRFKKMPQIVIIIDELADLMMVASKEVEEAICRLAQLARACGIHLVIATQRPSVNVITGLIKANVPSRIAFAVSSTIDSRTILDSGGAEKLLGKGDMLFYPAGYPKPVRVQGAFVSDQEVNAVVEFLANQNMAKYDSNVDAQIGSANFGTKKEGGNGEGTDDYFAEAGRFIIEKNKASIGMLQRVYKIGFNRAARIMDQLCAAGVVGPEEGTKPRRILMTIEEFEDYISG